jgi:hypothetical protein
MHAAYFILIYKQNHRQKRCLSLEYVAWLSFKKQRQGMLHDSYFEKGWERASNYIVMFQQNWLTLDGVLVHFQQ